MRHHNEGLVLISSTYMFIFLALTCVSENIFSSVKVVRWLCHFCSVEVFRGLCDAVKVTAGGRKSRNGQ